MKPNQGNQRSKTIDKIYKLELAAIDRGTLNYKNEAKAKLKQRIKALRNNAMKPNSVVKLNEILQNAQNVINGLNNMNRLQAEEAAKMPKKEFNNQLNAKITAIRNGMKGNNVPSLANLKKAVIGASGTNWLGGKMPKNQDFVNKYLTNNHIKKKIGEYMRRQANIKSQQAERRAKNEAANAITFGSNVVPAIDTKEDTGKINSSVPTALSENAVLGLINSIPTRSTRNKTVANLRQYLNNFNGNKSFVYGRARDTISDYNAIFSATNNNRKKTLTAILVKSGTNNRRKIIATKLYTNVHLERMEAKYGKRAKDVIRIDKKLSLIMPLRAKSKRLNLPGIESDIAKTFPNKKSKLMPSYKYLSKKLSIIKSSLNKK